MALLASRCHTYALKNDHNDGRESRLGSEMWDVTREAVRGWWRRTAKGEVESELVSVQEGGNVVELIESKERILRRMTRRQWVLMILFSPASNYSMVLEASCGRFRERPRVLEYNQRFLARALRASTELPPAIDVRSSSSSRPHPELVCRFQSLNSRSLRT